VRIVTVLAALSGAAAVAAGAFGAHGASGEAAEWLKTGGHYQLGHAVAALGAGRVGARGSPRLFVVGGAGVAGAALPMGPGEGRRAGAGAPPGGAALIAGWLCLAAGAWRAR